METNTTTTLTKADYRLLDAKRRLGLKGFKGTDPVAGPVPGLRNIYSQYVHNPLGMDWRNMAARDPNAEGILRAKLLNQQRKPISAANLENGELATPHLSGSAWDWCLSPGAALTRYGLELEVSYASSADVDTLQRVYIANMVKDLGAYLCYDGSVNGAEIDLPAMSFDELRDRWALLRKHVGAVRAAGGRAVNCGLHVHVSPTGYTAEFARRWMVKNSRYIKRLSGRMAGYNDDGEGRAEAFRYCQIRTDGQERYRCVTEVADLEHGYHIEYRIQKMTWKFNNLRQRIEMVILYHNYLESLTKQGLGAEQPWGHFIAWARVQHGTPYARAKLATDYLSLWRRSRSSRATTQAMRDAARRRSEAAKERRVAALKQELLYILSQSVHCQIDRRWGYDPLIVSVPVFRLSPESQFRISSVPVGLRGLPRRYREIAPGALSVNVLHLAEMPPANVVLRYHRGGWGRSSRYEIAPNAS